MDRAVIPVWPEGPPSVLPDVGPEVLYQSPVGGGPLGWIARNISEARLTIFPPAPGTANGTGVIIAPGGGFRIVAVGHEGYDLAEWLAAKGYTAFVLTYRVAATPSDPAEFATAMAGLTRSLTTPQPAATAPKAIEGILRGRAITAARAAGVDDARQALKIVRDRAGEWGIDPEKVGMIGFSAGAFITIDLALSGDGAPPAFVAPIYGGGAAGKPIPADAPPLFTCVAQDDWMMFRIVEGLYHDWSEADRPAELHVFTKGGHGFGMVKRGLPVDRWVDLLGDWLADRGFG